jgi:hypothetical protein
MQANVIVIGLVFYFDDLQINKPLATFIYFSLFRYIQS